MIIIIACNTKLIQISSYCNFITLEPSTLICDYLHFELLKYIYSYITLNNVSLKLM